MVPFFAIPTETPTKLCACISLRTNGSTTPARLLLVDWDVEAAGQDEAFGLPIPQLIRLQAANTSTPGSKTCERAFTGTTRHAWKELHPKRKPQIGSLEARENCAICGSGVEMSQHLGA